MIHIVNEIDVKDAGSDGNKFSAFASDLGIAPGLWPQFIGVGSGDGKSWMGNLFIQGPPMYHNKEFAGYHYFSKFGQELVIFND